MPDGVVFLPSFYEAIKDLADKERLSAYDAVVLYGLYGEVIEMKPSVKSLFVLMKPVIDSSQKRHRASKENGKKGGRPPKNQTDNQTDNQTNNQTENQMDNQTDNQDIEMDIDSDIEKDIDFDIAREKESLRGDGGIGYKPLPEDAFEKLREEGLRKLGL